MSEPDPIDYKSLPTLGPEQAVALWQQGKDAWNAWVQENPNYNVSFKNVTFPNGEVSFEDFRFPRGRIIFIRANFGDGGVSFFKTTFGDGDVSFTRATFGDGDVSFERATFGDGKVLFIDTRFGNGDVSFEHATFGNGDVFFDDATFGDGDVSFTFATFGDGDVSFAAATFGDGAVSFDHATFGDGDIWFVYAAFGEGTVAFERATFRDGTVSFAHANFGNGDVSFDDATFGDGNVSFRQTNFGDGEVFFIDTTFGNCEVDFRWASMASGDFIFDPASLGKAILNFSPMSFPGLALFEMKDARELDGLYFKGCSFAKMFQLQGKFNCVPDLRGTSTPHHVDLSRLTCDFPRDDRRKAKFLQKAADRDDSARLRRLKELAESNKHHAAALKFNALEMRAARWTDYGLAQSFLDLLYAIFSNYGRSILRPVVWLLVTIGVFTLVFAGLSPAPEAGLNAFALSLSNCLPFLPLTRDLHQTAVQALCISPELLVGGLSLFEGMLAFLFLFLIGLGLRNRFRL